MRALLRILWPSFLVAGFAEGLLFSLVDPDTLSLLDEFHDYSRLAVYSCGFFILWTVCAASSALTSVLLRSAAEINQCPLSSLERPEGCPRRGC